jgi:hypothetical protein
MCEHAYVLDQRGDSEPRDLVLEIELSAAVRAL